MQYLFSTVKCCFLGHADVIVALLSLIKGFVLFTVAKRSLMMRQACTGKEWGFIRIREIKSFLKPPESHI